MKFGELKIECIRIIDEEADEMYDEWDRLLRIRDELLAYEKCFENVLRAFGSIYSVR